MGNQLVFDSEEILEDPNFVEPLVINGNMCHGGFGEDGNYLSPRSKNRVTAIKNWQDNHVDKFKREIINIDVESFSPHWPSVEQMVFLLKSGVSEPIIAHLTRIGIVEGYGSLLRYVCPENLENCFVEDIRDSALGHLNKGLIEAHARDESGFEEKAGHSQMWHIIRDICFENPLERDEIQDYLKLANLPPSFKEAFAIPQNITQDSERLFKLLDQKLESFIRRLIDVLLIELRAYRVFSWANKVLSDKQLDLDPRGAEIVSYIRKDEDPHVAYLQTVLTEMRDRTFILENGKTLPGEIIVETLLQEAITNSKTQAEERNIKMVSQEISLAISKRKNANELLASFSDLEERHLPDHLKPRVI